MKSEKPTQPPLTVKANPPAVAKGGKAKPADPGIAERRHFIRPLPAPEAVESDGDSDWAKFQTLIPEQPKD
jgi:hypothetical protein